MDNMLKDHYQYQAFLLRCWEVHHPEHNNSSSWRFSLENARTGEKHAFPSFNALIKYLQINFVTGMADTDEPEIE